MNSSHSPAAISADGLTKKYGRRTVVDSVTFEVPAGAVCGLVGPNGAGKTTVMAMLLGLVRPSAGSAQVLGGDVRHPRAYMSRVGALIEYPAFHPGLSGAENLRHLCRLGGHSPREIPGLIELVGLAGRETDRFGSYSLGMKQRLGIAAALIGDPDLVVLDEPSNGVDPQGMKDIRALIGQIASSGRTVLVSSHLLAELEAVCDHLVVLDRGGCRFAGPIDGLGASRASAITTDAAVPRAELAGVLTRGGWNPVETADGLAIEVADADPGALAAQINAIAHENGIVLTTLYHHQTTLEDRVLELVSTGASS